MKDLTIRNSTAEFLIFQTQAKEDSIEVKYENETLWLSQKMMAKLFEVHVATINEHLKNIFKLGELNENSVVRNFLITASDGKNYKQAALGNPRPDGRGSDCGPCGSQEKQYGTDHLERRSKR